MLLTCISILAIDFQVLLFPLNNFPFPSLHLSQIFPRKFGKTEYYGVSLMDIGAGFFVICSALTSNYARKAITAPTNTTSPSSSVPPFSLLQRLLSMWQKVAVLLLGVGRLIVVKALNYQEHTSEYGTHWNFFVTLFFIWAITDSIHMCCVFMKWNQDYVLPVISLVTLVCYQYLLLSTPLTEYIFNTPRVSFISHNREGIFSLFGYVPLYLLTEWYSRLTFFRPLLESSSSLKHPNPPSSHHRASGKFHLKEFLWMLFSQEQFLSLCGGALVVFCCSEISTLFQLPSRRLMNLSFVCVVLLISLFNLLLLFLIQFLFQFPFLRQSPPPSPTPSTPPLPLSVKPSAGFAAVALPPHTLHLWNRHQLKLFLVANVLTGGVNLIFQTIYISTEGALLIIVSYTSLLVILSWVLR
jgi:glucosaminylphosphatidylinositol acyltransferase